jgi:alpha-L-fucosidase 2
MDNQIIRNLFRNTMEAGRILKKDRPFQKLLEEALPKLSPHQVGRHGQLQEWLVDFEESDSTHRHLSHLFAFYPDDDITLDKNPGLSQAVEKVMERKVDKYLGWSGAWKMNIYARLQRPEAAFDILKRMLVDISIHPREEDSKITPSFEGNQAIQGVTAGIAEMLMQSHSGKISLLPALPNAWKQGNISGLRARGGYSVDIEWENHRLKESRITSHFSQKCRLQTKEPVKVFAGNQVVSTNPQKDGTLEFDALAGKEYRIVVLK